MKLATHMALFLLAGSAIAQDVDWSVYLGGKERNLYC